MSYVRRFFVERLQHKDLPTFNDDFMIHFFPLKIIYVGWELRGLNCYKYFGIKHSWEKAAELCRR